MRAAVFREFQTPMSVEDVERPAVQDDSVIIQVAACGICRSDWHGWMGHDSDVQLPHVPGHELAGTIVEAGSHVRDWKPGTMVTVPFCCGCGTCGECASGHQHICDNYTQPGFTQWGAFAEYVEIRFADVNLVRLPEGMDPVVAASLGCRFATSFRAIMRQGRVTSSDIVAVHGCGGIGLSAVMIAAACGAKVVAIDISKDALALAAEAGAEVCLNAAEVDDVVAAVREATNGGATVSLDALGSRTTCFNSIACLRKRGRHVQVGLTAGPDADPPVPMSAIIGNELEVFGSHGLQASEYPTMLRMIAEGRLAPQMLISRTVSLTDSCNILPQMGDFANHGVMVINEF